MVPVWVVEPSAMVVPAAPSTLMLPVPARRLRADAPVVLPIVVVRATALVLMLMAPVPALMTTLVAPVPLPMVMVLALALVPILIAPVVPESMDNARAAA